MRSALLVAGFLVLGAAWLGPLPALAERAFFAHMTMHMAVVAVAAPLLAAGLAGGRHDPAAKWPRFFAPVPLSVLELVIVWSWHAPALHHAARHSSGGFLLEQGSFFGAGLLVWLSALGGKRPLSSQRAGAGVLALLLTSMHITLLGALMALTPRPLYLHSGDFNALSALGDQQLGGAIMILAGGASYLIGGLWLTFRLLRLKPAPKEVPA